MESDPEICKLEGFITYKYLLQSYIGYIDCQEVFSCVKKLN